MRPTTVDAVVIHAGKVLLVHRARPPFARRWALPGGFVGEHESAEQAVVRECAEETGVRVKAVRLIGVYSSPTRDPRKSITVAFLCRPVGPRRPRGGDDAAGAQWFPLANLPPLAFDHSEIIADALKLETAKTKKRDKIRKKKMQAARVLSGQK
ncbi:MAG: NUDIX hydrolase [Candidatus Micrarchaeia archaeon]